MGMYTVSKKAGRASNRRFYGTDWFLVLDSFRAKFFGKTGALKYFDGIY